MENFYLKGTEETPEIVFDKNKQEFRVTGKSYMEDATAHYTKVLAWLEEYSKTPNSSTIFKFQLEYVNTSSSKIVHDILNVLENIHLEGNEVLVEWYYYREDEDMLELGQEFEEIYEVPFKFEEINQDRSKNLFPID
ncbi:MAG: DUF1987 domain-containing protein [Cyclobacteriaceae bacterium]|nr:DUF1987 domain-containing protein [Cyclobacteriaceae bacterium]